MAGRPRFVSLPPDEMIALGKEMVEWVKKNNPLHLKQWYSFQKHILYSEWKAMIQISEFLPYYEEAIGLVGINYINGNIDKSIAQRFLRIYYKDLKEEEDETAVFNAQITKQAEVQGTEEQNKKLDELLSVMRGNQSSALNNPDNKIKSE